MAGGKPLLELNRVLRPGGYFIWSATPVYRQEQRDQDDWNAMVTLIKSICWRTVVKSQDVNGIGVVIYQKPVSNSCYAERKTNEPPLCSERDGSHFPWYAPLDSCLFTTAITTSDEGYNWPVPWPERLDVSVPDDSASNKEKFEADTKYWKQLIFQKYISVTSHLIGQAFAM
uniref:Methyltransferase n=1 Tax=Zea mays TaxID=4577 RepID=A0A804MSA8_MAIZE